VTLTVDARPLGEGKWQMSADRERPPWQVTLVNAMVFLNCLGFVIMGPIFVALGVVSFFKPVSGLRLFGSEVGTVPQKSMFTFLGVVITALGITYFGVKVARAKSAAPAGRGDEAIPAEGESFEDDTSRPTACLRCKKVIPQGETRCPSCGWTYKADAT